MDRSTLSEIVSQYAQHLQAEKGLAPPSQERYLALARGLIALCRHDPDALFLPPDWTLADLDRRVVESYLNALKAERGWKPMSHAFHVTALSAFFRFLKARHHIARNPCAHLRPRLSGELEAPPEGQADAVLRLLKIPTGTLDGARVRLAVELLYGGGLKPSQAFHITALELAAGHAPARYRVAGPDAGWREIAVSREGVACAERYLTLRTEVLAPKHAAQHGQDRESGADSPGQDETSEAFWIDRRGRPCSSDRLAKQVTRPWRPRG
jgi:site-specific recombinase XerC